MRAPNSAKPPARSRMVAVIASPGDLGRAGRLRRLPDLFEVRLDAFHEIARDLSGSIAALRAPVIITARHPAEGGHNDLAAARRRELLLEFLRCASYVDIELRSMRHLAAVIAEAHRKKVQLIISVHEFRRTPAAGEFRKLAAQARAASADVFKLATRVETAADLARLTAGFEAAQTELPTSAMGIGALGREARRAMIARGSVLNYAHLGTAQADGQFSLAELRRLSTAR